MKTITSALLALALSWVGSNAEADILGSGANRFEIEFVTIGNPGNPADTTGRPNPAGAVDYVYEIGKHEISRDMIRKANAEGGLGLTLHPMDFVDRGARPDMPATGVSWNEAARFVNWLNTSQGFPVAYKLSTQPAEEGYHPNANIELWKPADLGFDPTNLFRNRLAHYVLPSMNEWYKAAYYDPFANDGAGQYWNFPTGSDTEPTPVASGTDAGTAVIAQRLGQGPADITQAGGLSPYGVMGLGGNVWEWEETEFDLVNDTTYSIRGVRGGRWINTAFHLNARDRDDDDFPTFEFPNLGFRVAKIPAPTSQVEFELSPGAGRFQQAGDNLLLVEKIQDGYRVRTVQSGPNYGPIPRLLANWSTEAGQWYRFHAEINSVSITNDARSPQDAVAELESPQGLRFGSQILAADPPAGTYSFAWPYPTNADLGEVHATWEFMVVPIDAPMPGDANADGSVDFVDFLTLSRRFDSDGWGWSGADFNLDGTTNFNDFLILSENFGSPVAAAVPEPSSLALFALAVLAFARLRARRR